MAVKGKVRERTDFTKEVGFFEGKVIAVNPDQQELEKILGMSVDKEPEYLGEDKDGEKWACIVFYLRDVKTDKVRPSLRFFLKDKPKTTKEPREGQEKKVPKKQYINSLGWTTWADKEANLSEAFTKRDYRVANEGEGELYAFLSEWLGGIDWKDPDAELDFDFRKLMRGNVRELREQMGGVYEKTILCLSVIRTYTNKEGDLVEAEQIHNKDFLPGYLMPKIRVRKIDDEFIERANDTDKKKRDKLQRFVLSVTDKEFGIKEYYTLEELQPYDSSKNVAAGNNTNVKEDDTSY